MNAILTSVLRNLAIKWLGLLPSRPRIRSIARPRPTFSAYLIIVYNFFRRIPIYPSAQFRNLLLALYENRCFWLARVIADFVTESESSDLRFLAWEVIFFSLRVLKQWMIKSTKYFFYFCFEFFALLVNLFLLTLQCFWYFLRFFVFFSFYWQVLVLFFLNFIITVLHQYNLLQGRILIDVFHTYCNAIIIHHIVYEFFCFPD